MSHVRSLPNLALIMSSVLAVAVVFCSCMWVYSVVIAVGILVVRMMGFALSSVQTMSVSLIVMSNVLYAASLAVEKVSAAGAIPEPSFL